MASLFSALIVCAVAALTGCSGGGGSSGISGADVVSANSSITANNPITPPGFVQLSESPIPADTLADSIGVNTHLYEYGSDLSTIVSRVQSLGVRHLRDSIMNNNAPLAAAMSNLLSTAHAKLDGYTDCAGIQYNPYSPTSPAQIQEFNSLIANQLDAVEGPNEIDLRNDPNWVSDTMVCLPGLKSALPNLPFYAPSVGDQLSNATVFGDISNYVDFGNDHRYFNGHNPGSKGWGGTNSCGIYGALNWALCETRINSGQKPIVVTETGYSTPGEVDEVTQAKYLSRLFFVNLSAGVSRSYVYVLKDYTGDGFGGDGLLHSDDSPKPAYSAIASEIALFSDRGVLPSSVPLSYSISAQVSTIDHLLFRKTDGTYLMALWNEVPSWNPVTSTEIPVSPQQVTINLVGPVVTANAQSLDDGGTLATKAISSSGDSLTISVDDHMTFVSFL